MSDAAHDPDDDDNENDLDQVLAITAEGLYLSNLLLLPGISFLILVWLRWYYRKETGSLAYNHIDQTFFVSLWGGALLLIFSALFMVLGGLHSQWTWVVVILYFTCIHSTLVLLGVFGLSRAIAGREFIYPLIGPRRPAR
ncbi:MAG: hypothetical protein KBD60_08635 [Sterolibacterium sp.]|jgi:hypothetical protein|nr:hypothetical protein [Sterolibacterium sp.]